MYELTIQGEMKNLSEEECMTYYAALLNSKGVRAKSLKARKHLSVYDVNRETGSVTLDVEKLQDLIWWLENL